jgi:integrase
MESALTLVSFFRKYFARLFLDDARPRTFEAYEEALVYWRRITGDPALLFGAAVLAEFKIELHKTLSAATVNKHLRAVNAILAKAGPSGPGNRDALGMLPSTPWTKGLRQDRALPRSIGDDVVSAIYAAARFARWPKCETASGWATAWWRALICFAITTGFRRGVLLALRWADIDLAGRSVRVPASIDKCHAERFKPLHAIAVRHVLAIRGGGPLVFPFDGCLLTLHRQWHAIQDAADIATGEHIKLHDLKRFAGTRYAATSSPWVVQQMLDHSSIETSRFYVNSAEACRVAVDAFPLPDCFKEV